MKVPTVIRAQRYASVIVRWLVTGALVFALTMAAGYYVTNNVLTKVYTASSVVQPPASDLLTPAGSGLASMALQPEFVSTMMSPELLLSVVKDLGLDKEWARRLYNKTDDEQVPDVDALTHLEKLVNIRVQRGTDMVEITAASDVPREAADIANAIAAHYQALRDLQQPIGLDAGKKLVRIVELASIPTEPTKPNKGLDFIITFVAACVLSLLAASFVEMIFLFIRAGEREEG